MSTTLRRKRTRRGSLEKVADAAISVSCDVMGGAYNVSKEVAWEAGSGALRTAVKAGKAVTKKASELVWKASSSPYIAGALVGFTSLMGVYNHETRGLEAVKSGKNLVEKITDLDVIGTAKGVLDFGSDVTNTPGELIKGNVFNDIEMLADTTLEYAPYVLSGIAGLAAVKHVYKKSRKKAGNAVKSFLGKTSLVAGASLIAADMLRDYYFDKSYLARTFGGAVDLASKGLNLALMGSSHAISGGVNLVGGALSTFFKNPDLALHISGDDLRANISNVLHEIPADTSDYMKYAGGLGIATGLYLIGSSLRKRSEKRERV